MAPLSRLTALILVCLFACGDPVADDVVAYHAAMDPLMAENTRLASQFLVLAKAVHKDQQSMDGVVGQIEAQVIPAAQELQANISGIQPELEELADIHQQAVTAWTLQAQAYQDMAAAYKANDPAAFAAGQKKLGQAKVTIESYVKQVNRLLEPYGYHLDEFPPLK
jgi:hypothetical protein